jgi:hypothetical protein
MPAHLKSIGTLPALLHCSVAELAAAGPCGCVNGALFLPEPGNVDAPLVLLPHASQPTLWALPVEQCRLTCCGEVQMGKWRIVPAFSCCPCGCASSRCLLSSLPHWMQVTSSSSPEDRSPPHRGHPFSRNIAEDPFSIAASVLAVVVLRIHPAAFPHVRSFIHWQASPGLHLRNAEWLPAQTQSVTPRLVYPEVDRFEHARDWNSDRVTSHAEELALFLSCSWRGKRSSSQSLSADWRQAHRCAWTRRS